MLTEDALQYLNNDFLSHRPLSSEGKPTLPPGQRAITDYFVGDSKPEKKPTNTIMFPSNKQEREHFIGPSSSVLDCDNYSLPSDDNSFWDDEEEDENSTTSLTGSRTPKSSNHPIMMG